MVGAVVAQVAACLMWHVGVQSCAVIFLPVFIHQVSVLRAFKQLFLHHAKKEKKMQIKHFI